MRNVYNCNGMELNAGDKVHQIGNLDVYTVDYIIASHEYSIRIQSCDTCIWVMPQSLELVISDNPVDFNRVLPV